MPVTVYPWHQTQWRELLQRKAALPHALLIRGREGIGKLDFARKLAVNSYSCVNASAQYAALAALTGPQDDVHKMVAEFDRRRKVVVEGLNRLLGVSCAMPKGAFYAFPNVKQTGWKAKPSAR